MTTPTNSPSWIRGPIWDSSFLAWGWAPLYLWMATGPVGSGWGSPGYAAAFAQALFIALALNFVHRHYAFVLVYGDKQAIAERPRAYIVAPIVAFAAIGGSILSANPILRGMAFGVLGVWNVYHVVMQRYGILRIYAGRSGLAAIPDGADASASPLWFAKRDLALLVSLVLITASGLLLFRLEPLTKLPQLASVRERFEPIVTSTPARLFLGAILTGALATVIRWARAELNSPVKGSRGPRLAFVASTLAIFSEFFIHDPILGYLCFGNAHSIEYIAFVHHFGERKYANDSSTSVAARAFRSLRRFPLVLAPLVIAYLALRQYRLATAYIAYYSSTSALHFLYDGWIWKVRKPGVAKPLALASSPPASTGAAASG